MATEALTVGSRFPVGTSVGAYPESNWPAHLRPPSGAPVGSATTTATVASAGTVTFTGLTADTRYVAYAQVSGVHRYTAFRTPALDDVEKSRRYPAATQASIFAAAAELDAAGGGIVELPEGSVGGVWAPIPLTAPLPAYRGVVYRGVTPGIVPRAGRRETDFDFVSGTVFDGGGSGRGFEVSATGAADPPDQDGATGYAGVGLIGIGFQNFADAIVAGARNVFGLHLGGIIDQIYITDCAGWGMDLCNCTAIEIGFVRITQCGGTIGGDGQITGQARIRVDMKRIGGAPGNHRIGHIYTNMPRPGDRGLNGRKVRGLVFEVSDGGGNLTSTSNFNEVTIDRLQSNGFNRTVLSVTATFTNGQSAIGVPDGTQFAVGQLVNFTASGFGFFGASAATATAPALKGRGYIVRSVTGNQITLASGKGTDQPVIAATGDGTLTLETYGFPNLEIATLDDSSITNFTVSAIDVEGPSPCGLYMEGVNNAEIKLGSQPSTAGIADVVLRGVSYSLIKSNIQSYDADNGSSTTQWVGHHAEALQYRLPGLARDNIRGANRLLLGATGGHTPAGLEVGPNGAMFPRSGMGQRTLPRSADTTLIGTNMGILPFVVSAPRTATLPTLVSDALTGTSYVGAIWDIVNMTASTHDVTVNTDGSQVFNRVASLTSLAVRPGTGLRIEGVSLPDGTFTWKTQAYGSAGVLGLLGGKPIPLPGASDNLKIPQYNHTTGEFAYVDPATGPGNDPRLVIRSVAADVTVAAQTVQQNITGLNFTIGASATEVWRVMMLLLVEAANNTMDAKVGWTFPSGCTISHGPIMGSGLNLIGGWGATQTSGTPIVVRDQTLNAIFGTIAGTIAVPYLAIVKSGGTGGTVQAQFSQQVSDAGNLSIKTGSVLEAVKAAA